MGRVLKATPRPEAIQTDLRLVTLECHGHRSLDQNESDLLEYRAVPDASRAWMFILEAPARDEVIWDFVRCRSQNDSPNSELRGTGSQATSLDSSKWL